MRLVGELTLSVSFLFLFFFGLPFVDQLLMERFALQGAILSFKNRPSLRRASLSGKADRRSYILSLVSFFFCKYDENITGDAKPLYA